MKAGILVLMLGVGLFAADTKVNHVVEAPGARVTVSTRKQGKLTPGAMRGLAIVYVKIENLADQPLEFNQDSASLLTAAGKSLRRYTAEEATAVFQSNPFIRTLTIEAKMDNPALISARAKREELAGGAIPAKSWREGLIYFEGTGDMGKQKRPVKLLLPPFIPDGVDINW